jgi:hypothetical protein
MIPTIERPMNQPGFYSVVRFCPDSDRGEAVNIGVIVGAPALGLRLRMAEQNERVERWFGTKAVDGARLTLIKDGFAERLKEVEPTAEALAAFGAAEAGNAIRQLGTLGTTAAAENVLLSVAAGFRDVRHRVGYRTALDQLDLLAHPSRSIQVALAKPTRSETLSGRRLTVVQEPEAALEVGAKKQDGVFISDLERSLLDAAARPELVGGIAVLAEALGAASSKGVDGDRLTNYARVLSWGPALRRIGSLADTLHIAGLAGRLDL